MDAWLLTIGLSLIIGSGILGAWMDVVWQVQIKSLYWALGSIGTLFGTLVVFWPRIFAV